MKILHLSTSDINGGAAKAAYRLHAGLVMQGIDSQMFVCNKTLPDESVVRYKYPSGLRKVEYRYRKFIIEKEFNQYRSTLLPGLEVFSDDRTPLKTGFFRQLPEADVYNIHWTSGFLDLTSFLRKINKPVVWTLHDMFPFTGGCHYNVGCENYLGYCHKCPQIGSVKVKDISYHIWTRKQKAISEFGNKILIRADSFWLAEEARRSSLFKGLNVDTIHYGIETDEFIPRNKISCRRAFNIPEKSKVIVFGALGINNPRKGYKKLIGALHGLKNIYPDLFLLSFGAGQFSPDIEIPSIHLGHVANNHLLSLIYNCADVFVIPSLQEAFGQTALEAMSCSVPVAGFDTGGIPDMIENGVTGYLAETGSTEELANAISQVLQLKCDEYNKMAVNCREKVLSGFTLTHQAERYICEYRKIAGHQV